MRCIPRNWCGVSTSAIARPPVDMVERNHAQVTCLTRSRRPTVGMMLPDSSCFATPGFGDVLSVEDILEAQTLEWEVRLLVWWSRGSLDYGTVLVSRCSRPRNVNEKR